MNSKEGLFCEYYQATGNIREAAAKAGVRLMPERWGMKLLARPDIQQQLQAIERRKLPERSGIAGLKRIAFGSAADAVGLVLASEAPSALQLEAMDLFMISEIKRPKGGGIEIKFYDRLKALELLTQLQNGSERDEVAPFYQALHEGALRLKGVEEG